MPETARVCFFKAKASSHLFQQLSDRAQELIDGSVPTLGQILDHTATNVALQEQFAHGIKGGARRRNLAEHIIAVGVSFNHGANAPDLSLDPVEPGAQGLFEGLIPLCLAGGIAVCVYGIVSHLS